MLLTPFAVIAGLITGLLRGGRFENLLRTTLVWAPVVLLGFVVQTAAELIDVPARLSVFIVGAFVLIVGLCQNLHIRGVAIIVIGLSSNLVAAVANGYVPVRLEALIGAGKVEATIDPETVVSIGALGQLEDDQTQLGFLGDIVPIGLINDVVSFGDLILIAGLFVLAMNLVTERRRAVRTATTGTGTDSVNADRADRELAQDAAIDLRSDAEPIDAAPNVVVKATTSAADTESQQLDEPHEFAAASDVGAVAADEEDSALVVESASQSDDSAGLTPDEFLAELAAAGSGSAPTRRAD